MSYFLRKELEIRKLALPLSILTEKNEQGRIDPTEAFEEEKDEMDPYELWLQAKTMISQQLAQNASEPQK